MLFDLIQLKNKLYKKLFDLIQLKNLLYKMFFDLIQFENRLYSMFFNFIKMENRMYYMLLDFIHFDKMGVKMVFHVIIQPQRFNLVFDLMHVYSYKKAIQYSYTYICTYIQTTTKRLFCGNRLT